MHVKFHCPILVALSRNLNQAPGSSVSPENVVAEVRGELGSVVCAITKILNELLMKVEVGKGVRISYTPTLTSNFARLN